MHMLELTKWLTFFDFEMLGVYEPFKSCIFIGLFYQLVFIQLMYVYIHAWT